MTVRVFNGMWASSSNFHQISSLAKLVSTFPAPQRPRFADTSGQDISPLATSEHITKPDLVVSHPGQAHCSNAGEWIWPSLSSTVEVKRLESRDPFDEAGELKIGDDHAETIIQVAKNGRNLLLGNLSCAAFVLGMYGSKARIYRFDRAGVVVSRSFDYVASPALLGEFYWRLVHPIRRSKSSGDGIIVGADRTITGASDEDKAQVAEFLQRYHGFSQENASLAVENSLCIMASHRLPSGSEDKPTCVDEGNVDGMGGASSPMPTALRKCFSFGEPLYLSTGLFSRATIVWQVLVEGYEETSYALKDYWREVFRKPESYFYERIEERCHGREHYGLAQCKGSVDLGASREGMQEHRTCSALLRSGNSLLDRSHMRILLSPVGQQLSTFKNTKRLVCALRDAIKGETWQSVLFRDILHTREIL
jgi:hypothetical protein